MTGDLRSQLQAALGAAYTVERELGGGGMSRVFVATETTLGRKVVVKVLPPDLAAELSVERFRREVQVAAQLQNPRIVPLLAAGEAGGLLYYTMPYVEGESLRAQLLREGELPVGVTLQILRDVAKALACAHEHGVVHRDIKPENILLAAGDALVTDFGVAKAVSASTSENGSGLTSVGLALGTPAYMAPEQAAGDVAVDHRADLYALGAVAYEMLTGQGMFPGRSPQALLAAQTTETPEAIERRRPSVPASLAALVTRLLAKRPADRPQSADELLRELDLVTLGAGTGFTKPPEPSPAHRAAVPRAVRILGAIVLLAVIVWTATALGRRLGRPTEPSDAGDQASVVVLPFVNMSGDKENEYFSDGMTEELIDRLANVQGLRVVAHTSAFAFKGRDVDAREIGRLLDVRNVVEGSVRRIGSHVRVTAQLVDARRGYHRWSHSYDAELRDAFAVQAQIGTAIASELKLALAARDSAALARAPTHDTLAHSLYLQGRYLWNKRTGEALQGAVRLFLRAISRDSTYADAWDGLAETYSVLPSFADISADSTITKAIEAADRALALDSTLAGARAARANALAQLWRWDGAEREFRRAIALNPNYATAHQWFALMLLPLHREAEALAESKRATVLDPLSVAVGSTYGNMLYRQRRYIAAEAQLRVTLDRDPTSPFALARLGMVLVQLHQLDSAMALLRRAVALEGEHGWSGYLGQLGYAYAVAGRRDSARAVLQALQQRAEHGHVVNGAIAVVQLGLGERDAAFASLAKGIDARDISASSGLGWAVDPIFDGVRSDPRYRALLKRAGLR